MQKFPCLVKRDGTYYVRKKVPPELVPVLKRRELKRTLNTKDPKEAHRQYHRVLGQLLSQLAEAQERVKGPASSSPLADEALRETVRRWFFRIWEQCQRGFSSPPREGEPAPDEIVAQAEMELDSLHTPEGWPLAFAGRLLKAEGHAAGPRDVQRVAEYVRRGMAVLNGAILEHYRDHRLHHEIDDPLFRGVAPGNAIPAPAPDGGAVGLSVDEAIKRFQTDPQRRKLSPKNRLGYLMPSLRAGRGEEVAQAHT